MRSIRQKISRPYLLIIVLIPLSILILFNFIVGYYSRLQALEDLQQAVEQIENTLENQDVLDLLEQNPHGELPGILAQRRDQALPSMLSLLGNQRHTNSAELVVFNRNGELSRIFNADTFVTENLADLIYETTEELSFNEIGSFRFEDDAYYVVEVEYQSQTLTDKVVYISKGLAIDEFVRTVNIVLAIISVLITLIALFVSTRVTNSIAKPIERLISRVENMKSDELVVIDDHSDSLELQKFTTEINALNRRIYQYNESQKSFLHNASHELRTPLMSIQGYADGIEMGVFEDYKGTAHLISDQSKRLTKLVDGLLTLARAENFSANKKLERLSLSDCLFEVLEGYRGYAVSCDIEIITDIAPDLYAHAHSELLAGSVGNIVSNGIRYAKTAVYVSLKSEGKTAVITVRDDGNGISNSDKIFERFNKGADGNFGLGLSIAKTSVEMMNGHIRAYNDNGAVFEIILDMM